MKGIIPQGKPRNIKPCVPCTHSEMNKFITLISFGNKDKTYEEGITGSSIQEELNRELELENTGRIDRYLENSDLYSSPLKY